MPFRVRRPTQAGNDLQSNAQKPSGGIIRYHGQDLRRGRHSEPGHIYHITAVTRDRVSLFHSLAAARVVVRVLADLHAHGRAETLAYVLMPDHLHWLMRLGEAADLSKTVGTMKSLSARHIGISPLWQAGFHDHAIRRDEDIRAVARYIVANPVRAGLVQDIGQYPHWDAMWL